MVWFWVRGFRGIRVKVLGYGFFPVVCAGQILQENHRRNMNHGERTGIKEKELANARRTGSIAVQDAGPRPLQLCHNVRQCARQQALLRVHVDHKHPRLPGPLGGGPPLPLVAPRGRGAGAQLDVGELEGGAEICNVIGQGRAARTNHSGDAARGLRADCADKGGDNLLGHAHRCYNNNELMGPKR